MLEWIENRSCRTSGAPWLLVMLGSALMFVGLGFSALLLKGFLAASAYDSWVPREATVLSSWIEEIPQPGSDPSRYRFRLRYRYRMGETWQIGTRFQDIERKTRSRERVERLLNRYGPCTSVRCYVNPEVPEESMLIRPTKAPGYTLWFPGLFVVGGSGMCVVAFRRRTAVAKH